ncbi:hypothetical protein [Haloferula sp.]|uniref:hypothetical protein n=1 Tax=Haloferula sp. TaxID=2497595 RepID=UPI00329B2AD7
MDLDGAVLWARYHTFKVEAGKPTPQTFPGALSAYWARAVSDTDSTATSWFKYE